MKNKIENYYALDYFENYQKEIGEFGGKANVFKFTSHIKPDDTVLDFGCGGGFLLKYLNCRKKIGVELNPVARTYCNEFNNINCYESLEEIADESIDVVISNHCLEHTLRPFELIETMYKKLKKSGKIIIVVPLDSYRNKWRPNDIDNHLYSFSPMNLGNILQGCGLTDIYTMPVLHKWPPMYGKVYKYLGEVLFHKICWFYGIFINKKWVQIKAIGVKP